jgi:hypothetical protein
MKPKHPAGPTMTLGNMREHAEALGCVAGHHWANRRIR